MFGDRNLRRPGRTSANPRLVAGKHTSIQARRDEASRRGKQTRRRTGQNCAAQLGRGKSRARAASLNGHVSICLCALPRRVYEWLQVGGQGPAARARAQ
jgi:hypothetical protein